MGVIYSYPAILDEGVHLNEMMNLGLDHVSDVYKTCKELNEPIINLSEYDISTNQRRSFTVANPINVIEEETEIFNGAIIWESMDLTKIFKEMIIPKSFTAGKYPFI